MGIVARVSFVLAVVVAPIVVWTTSAQLPARVASHFGRGGYANGFMSHDAYVLFMLAMTTILPLVVVARSASSHALPRRGFRSAIASTGSHLRVAPKP